MSSPHSHLRLRSVVDELKNCRKRKSGQGDASFVRETKVRRGVPLASDSAIPKVSYTAHLNLLPVPQFGCGDRKNVFHHKSLFEQGDTHRTPSQGVQSSLFQNVPLLGFAEFDHLGRLAGIVSNLSTSDETFANANSSKADEKWAKTVWCSTTVRNCEARTSDVVNNTSQSRETEKSHQALNYCSKDSSKKKVVRHSPRSAARSKVAKIVKTHLSTQENSSTTAAPVAGEEFVCDGSMSIRGVNMDFMYDPADHQRLFLMNDVKAKLFPEWEKLTASHRVLSLLRKLKCQPRKIKSIKVSGQWSYVITEEHLLVISRYFDSLLTHPHNPTSSTDRKDNDSSSSFGLMQWHGSSVPFVIRDGQRYLVRNLLRSLLVRYQNFTAAHFGVMCNSLCLSVPCNVLEVDWLSKLVPEGFTVTRSTRLVSVRDAEKIYEHVVRKYNVSFQKQNSKGERFVKGEKPSSANSRLAWGDSQSPPSAKQPPATSSLRSKTISKPAEAKPPTHWKKACKQRATAAASQSFSPPSDFHHLPTDRATPQPNQATENWDIQFTSSKSTHSKEGRSAQKNTTAEDTVQEMNLGTSDCESPLDLSFSKKATSCSASKSAVNPLSNLNRVSSESNAQLLSAHVRHPPTLVRDRIWPGRHLYANTTAIEGQVVEVTNNLAELVQSRQGDTIALPSPGRCNTAVVYSGPVMVTSVIASDTTKRRLQLIQGQGTSPVADVTAVGLRPPSPDSHLKSEGFMKFSTGHGDSLLPLTEAYRCLQHQYQLQCERNRVLCSILAENEYKLGNKTDNRSDSNNHTSNHADQSLNNALVTRQAYEEIKIFREQVTQLTNQVRERDEKIRSLEETLRRQRGKEMTMSRPS